MAKSSIEWTDQTWNPVRGCTAVSPGCEHCYAMGIAARFSGPGLAYEGLARFSPRRRLPQWTGDVRFVPEKLDEPLHWRKPSMVFTNSQSDLFHNGFTNDQIAAVFGVMSAASKHTFQVLTKRAKRMREWFAWAEKRGHDGAKYFPDDPLDWRIHQMLNVAARKAGAKVPSHHGGAWPLPNVWLGVSAEDQERADERIPELLATPAAVRWVSVEPQLGPVSLRVSWTHVTPGSRLHWIVQGGESGPGARPFDLAWARSLRDECKETGVAYFLKQLGSNAVGKCERCTGDGIDPVRVDGADPEWCSRCGGAAQSLDAGPLKFPSKKGGDWSAWPEDLRVREYPRMEVA
jgi:protein gp37